MLVDCEVWLLDGGVIRKKGMEWPRQKVERRVIDTDLYEWFGDVEEVACDSYPYPDQCRVPHRNGVTKGICVSRPTLQKIRNLLGAYKAVVIE